MLLSKISNRLSKLYTWIKTNVTQKKGIILSTINPVLSLEREVQLLDSIAKIIVKYDLGMPANLLLEIICPLSYIGSTLFLLPSAPFLELFGIPGYEYTELFRKRDNIKRLIRKIEEYGNVFQNNL